MRKRALLISSMTALLLSALSITAAAQFPTREGGRQAAHLLNRLEQSTDIFRTSLDRMPNRTTYNRTTPREDIDRLVSEFDQASSQLSRNSSATDVEEVLRRGWYIDNFLRSNYLNTDPERSWRAVREDLRALAGYYNITWRWEDRAYNPGSSAYNNSGPLPVDPRENAYPRDTRDNTYPYPRDNSYAQTQRGGAYGNLRLTGTYTINRGRSDNVQRAVDQAVSGMDAQQSERVRASLMRRLEAPDRIAIEQRGRNITIASSSAPQATIEADGQTQTETRPNGRTVNTTANLNGNSLTIASMGDRGSDFQVTFEPMNNGRGLRVIKRIYTERLDQPIEVVGNYDRVSEIAQFNVYDGQRNPGFNGRRNNPAPVGRGNARFAIPDGTLLTARLNEDLTTRRANNNDRFTMTVTSPGQFDGAVIEGYITNVDRSGRVSGRAEMGLEFERLRMNGRTYEFGGYIEQVRTPDGENVRVNSEGVKEDDSQTNRTVARSGIGAALGAIIGGITGGGSGAAIGAAIGAGAGAGTVLVQGRDDLDLARGSEFTIRTSAPRSIASDR
jgi:hypothetical protein